MFRLVLDDKFRSLAEFLGFSECVAFQSGNSVFLVYTYWRNAPVVLKLNSGLAGGISVAFFRGSTPVNYGLPPQVDRVTIDKNNHIYPVFKDEVLDSSFIESGLKSKGTTSSFFDFVSTVNPHDVRTVKSPEHEFVDFWDEIVDTRHCSLDVLLVIGKSLLEFYSDSREVIYQGIKHEVSY